MDNARKHELICSDCGQYESECKCRLTPPADEGVLRDQSRLLSDEEIAKFHWIYISPASIETTKKLLRAQDVKTASLKDEQINALAQEITNLRDEFLADLEKRDKKVAELEADQPE